MRSIDLNADVGEGAADDPAIIAQVTSVNIACGAHAGDLATIERAVKLAIEHGAVIGAHPGHADRKSCGRQELPVTPAEVEQLVTQQINYLANIAQRNQTAVKYVKLHGALYHQASRDSQLAAAVVRTVKNHASPLCLLGQARSWLQKQAEESGVTYFTEGFIDRAYLADGSLAPRSQPGAMLRKTEDAVRQALDLALRQSTTSQAGQRIEVRCNSLCLHGDGPRAAQLAQAVHEALVEAKFAIRPFALRDGGTF